MKSPATLLTITLLSLSTAACAGTGKPAAAPASKTASNAAASGNTTSETTATTFDSDDNPVRYYGHEAGAGDRQAITALLTHYYAAAAREDGAKACPLINSLIAETILENYGHQPASRGKTCAVIMSKLFKQTHQQLTVDSATLTITSVRVEGGTALVLLRFAKAPLPNHIAVHREGRTWKIWELFDAHMP